MAYITTADLKTYAAITTANDDTLIGTLITAAQAFIEGPHGAQRIYEVTADSTHYFDPTIDVDGRLLLLDHDLCQITSVTNGNGVVVASSEYVCETAWGARNQTPWRQLRLKGSSSVSWTYTTSPENSIAIVGRWGYSASAPERIKQLCRELVTYFYRKRASSSDADRPLLTGDGVTILPAQLPSGIMAALKAERPET